MEQTTEPTLAKNDKGLKLAMKTCGYEFEITDTMTSREGWREFRRIENCDSNNNGGEDNMTTWDGYSI